MKVLFAHRVFPGQFNHLVQYLSRDNRHTVKFLAYQLHEEPPAAVQVVRYQPSRAAHDTTHPCVMSSESAVLFGQAAYRAAAQLKLQGFEPDVIFGHSGWGPTLYLRDLFPKAIFLGYFEWFYRARGSSHGFHPNIPLTPEFEQQIRTKNVPILLDLTAAQAGITPTHWQRQQFPAEYRHKIEVIHDGVDTDFFSPARQDLHLPRLGLDLRGKRQIVTYVATGMEPMRGFPEFMKMASWLQRRFPHCEVVVVGEDRTEYSNPLASGKTYRQLMLELFPYDMGRLHFTGRLSLEEYRQVLQASAVHVYLTFPFILSWSALEAMSCGCLVVGSATPPVQEVIQDKTNGLLADFFDVRGLAERVAMVLDNPAAFDFLRENARETVLQKYDSRLMLERQLNFVQQRGNL
ncbi:MAG: glycosyltransferase [Veillonellaceae bacterium]|nr:glycosyltransferase [Veillonellaceae bacterium]